MNQIVQSLLVFLAVYVLVVVFTCIGELTYQGKTRKEVLQNFQTIALRSLLLVVIMTAATAVYHLFGIRSG